MRTGLDGFQLEQKCNKCDEEQNVKVQKGPEGPLFPAQNPVKPEYRVQRKWISVDEGTSPVMPELEALSTIQVVGEPLVMTCGMLTCLVSICRLCNMQTKNAATETHKTAILWCFLNIIYALFDQTALTLILKHSPVSTCRILWFFRNLNLLSCSWMTCLFLFIIMTPHRKFPYVSPCMILIATATLIVETFLPLIFVESHGIDLCVRDEQQLLLDYRFICIDHIPLVTSLVFLVFIRVACYRKKLLQAWRLFRMLCWLQFSTALTHLPFWMSNTTFLSLFFAHDLILHTLYFNALGCLVEKLLCWVVVPLVLVEAQSRFVKLVYTVEDDVAHDSNLVLVELEDLEQPTFSLADVNERTDL
ncbi:uncharacterized protein LOC132201789 isoform X1 [Neocloeon triangulifer]|uniref:uncharacterized protein LOC132201789 isoform X1 n=1 Tax=Neocloeon triangulifer TaxID=2078957 RepID=UPI00286F661C|nr:uncharacterized protein LOC132201789 isoform X1 [Neocloeon triangulifer]